MLAKSQKSLPVIARKLYNVLSVEARHTEENHFKEAVQDMLRARPLYTIDGIILDDSRKAGHSPQFK